MTLHAAPDATYGAFARFYDAVYSGLVDYDGDAQFVVDAFDRFARRDVSRVIDAGCGTGTHALLLAERGFTVEGVDVSPGLLAEAREKKEAAGDAGARVRFHEADMAEFLPEGRFDAVVSLFGAFAYLLSDEAAGAFLDLAADRVDEGGLLVFEFWNPVGVEPQRGWVRAHLPGDRHLYRLAESEFNADRDVVEITFEFLVIDEGRVVDHFTETHHLRARTIGATRALLAAHGWESVAFTEGAREGKSFKPAAFDAFRVMAIARRT